MENVDKLIKHKQEQITLLQADIKRLKQEKKYNYFIFYQPTNTNDFHETNKLWAVLTSWPMEGQGEMKRFTTENEAHAFGKEKFLSLKGKWMYYIFRAGLNEQFEYVSDGKKGR